MLRFDPCFGRVRNAQMQGKRAAVVTALPKNDLGRPVEGFIIQGGVDMSHVIWRNFDGLGKNTRVGLNFTEKGFGIRSPLGCSDRGHGAASQIKPGEVNWEKLFGEESVRWLVPEVETLITGSVLPVDDGDHTVGGVPCQT